MPLGKSSLESKRENEPSVYTIVAFSFVFRLIPKLLGEKQPGSASYLKYVVIIAFSILQGVCVSKPISNFVPLKIDYLNLILSALLNGNCFHKKKRKALVLHLITMVNSGKLT